MSLKDLTSSNSYFRDQNLCFSLRKLLCLFFCLFVLFFLWLLLVYMSLHGDCDLNSAFFLLVQNTRNPQNPLFSSEQDMIYPALTE